jgi:hypothetical protein
MKVAPDTEREPNGIIIRALVSLVDVKKLQPSSFPPEEVRKFRRAVRRWLVLASERGISVDRWAKETADDDDVVSALLELVSWHKVAPKDLLGFLEELRVAHVPARELRARIRAMGRAWKEVELLAVKTRKESEPYLGEFIQKALEVENDARFLSRFFSTPRAKRPMEFEIAQCKADIKSFLRRRGVHDLNQYGWILLKAVFGNGWSAGDGKDQIEAFRQIPRPFTGKILTRADAERVMEKAKVELFRMEQAAKKS